MNGAYLTNDFYFDRYTSERVKNNPPQVDLNLINRNITAEPKLSLEDEFNIFLAGLEAQNNRKYSRNERRELFRKFQKSKKRKK